MIKQLLPSVLIVILFFSACSNQKRQIEIVDVNRLDEIIKNREGKILFLNIWATWCVPCVEEFPALVKLNDHYSEYEVEFIGLSVNSETDIDSLIIPFVERNGVKFEIYVADESAAEEIIQYLNEDWSGAIPVSVIFDRNGKQKKFLLGAHSFEFFRMSIDSVLSEKI
jgi:thiol-disulfide isomerase/thioredoxin